MATTFLLPVIAACLPLWTQTAENQEGPPAQGHVYFLAEPSAFEGLMKPRLQSMKSVFRLPFDSKLPAPKADPGLQDLLELRDTLQESRDASALLLSGGSFMGWYHLAYPKETVSYLPQILVNAAKSKKPIFAVGGACAFLGGGVVVARKDLDKPQRNPRLPKDAPEARVNLDLGPGLMFGSDSWKGSSPRQLLRAMHANQVRRAAYFVGPVMLEFHRPTRTLVVRGPGRLIIFDMTRARTFPHGYRGGRLSSLGDGDSWKVGSAPILMGKGKAVGEPPWILSSALPRDAQQTDSENRMDPAPFSGNRLLQWLERPRSSKSSVQGQGASWRVDWDERSQRQLKADSAGRRTWLNVPFDCTWREAR